jgi:hypothetical protein
VHPGERSQGCVPCSDLITFFMYSSKPAYAHASLSDVARPFVFALHLSGSSPTPSAGCVQTSFLLLVALLPPVMALVCVGLIRPLPPTAGEAEQEEEHAHFLVVYRLALALAAFLLATILARDLLHATHRLDGAATSVMLLLIAAVGGIPVREYWRHAAHSAAAEAEPGGAAAHWAAGAGRGLGPAAQMEQHERHNHDEDDNWLDVENRAESIAYGLRTEEDLGIRRDIQESVTFWQRHGRRKASRRKQAEHGEVARGAEGVGRVEREAAPLLQETASRSQGPREEGGQPEMALAESPEEAAPQRQEVDGGGDRGPSIGADHGVLEAFATVDFWVLFFSSMCGAGSGLTAINK